jgi:hypothetical protein
MESFLKINLKKIDFQKQLSHGIVFENQFKKNRFSKTTISWNRF